MPKVTVYTLPVCVQCDRTKKLLDRQGIEYDTVDLSQEPELAAKFKEDGFLQAPIVVVGSDGPRYIEDSRRWGGFRPDLIKELVNG